MGEIWLVSIGPMSPIRPINSILSPITSTPPRSPIPFNYRQLSNPVDSIPVSGPFTETALLAIGETD